MSTTTEVETSMNTSKTTSISTAPTIKLQIIEGPTLAQNGSVCYYRVKAIVTGESAPTIKFSKDDIVMKHGAKCSTGKFKPR